MELLLIGLGVIAQLFMGVISDKKWRQLTSSFNSWRVNFLITILIASLGFLVILFTQFALGGLFLFLPIFHLALLQLFNLIIKRKYNRPLIKLIKQTMGQDEVLKEAKFLDGLFSVLTIVGPVLIVLTVYYEILGYK